MDAKRKKTLEKKGWKSGTVAEFLELSPEDEQIVEIRVRLAGAVRELRKKKRVSQKQLAERIQSTQPSVARMETGSASIDMTMRALVVLGASRKEIAKKLSAA